MTGLLPEQFLEYDGVRWFPAGPQAPLGFTLEPYQGPSRRARAAEEQGFREVLNLGFCLYTHEPLCGNNV